MRHFGPLYLIFLLLSFAVGRFCLLSGTPRHRLTPYLRWAWKHAKYIVLRTCALVILVSEFIISRLVFNFELRFLMWAVHFTFSCIYTPRNFVSVLNGISLSSSETRGKAGNLFWVVSKDIADVFLVFTIKLFEKIHVCISCMTLLSLDCMVFKFPLLLVTYYCAWILNQHIIICF